MDNSRLKINGHCCGVPCTRWRRKLGDLLGETLADLLDVEAVTMMAMEASKTAIKDDVKDVI